MKTRSDAEEFYGRLVQLLAPGAGVDDEPARISDSFLAALSGRGDRAGLPPLFDQAVDRLHDEFRALKTGPRSRWVDDLVRRLGRDDPDDPELLNALWRALFPEALHLDDDPERQIPKLRDRRRVTVRRVCPDPVADPSAELVFTSNVLLSPPESGLESTDPIVAGAAAAGSEPQRFWYDHPIPVGTPLESDEAVYGLKGLSNTLRFEKQRGTVPPEARLTVILSVSVTHSGLHEWAGPWLKSQLSRLDSEDLDGLDVYAVTEDVAESIVDLLTPWLPDRDDARGVREVFGVDGEYGRHYSVLKALPYLWSVFLDPGRKGTFKIDLDQVFPQDELTAETGQSAFEHFRTPLWGASAVDHEGNDVDLGMIAGALVNEKDIAAGLFTPDIPWPPDRPEGEDLIFFKQRPMAVSTRAELMTRYGAEGAPDGENTALHRIHVTGGTNGIRFDALRQHRPFTPTFVGRAEDQSYILSVLHPQGGSSALRYLHASGLVMRHDKEAFASGAVKAGKAGSYVGDLVRLFVFSRYADALPGGLEGIKSEVDPFTGCFITPIPATLAMLRLALHLRTAEAGTTEQRQQILDLAAVRLLPWLEDSSDSTPDILGAWRRERRAWDAFYDAVERLETALERRDSAAQDTRESFRRHFEAARITD